MKNRITKNIKPSITSLTDAENRMHDLARAQNEYIRLTAEMDEQILAVKKDYDAQRSAAEGLVKQFTDELEAWASANPNLFEKRKSMEFLNGVLGFRTGTPKLTLLRGWNWQTVTDAVEQLLPNFIRSKPEVDKESLIAQRDEEAVQWALPKVGLKVTQAEKFFVEPKLTEVKEAA